MPSSINPDWPVNGNPTTGSVRSNFSFAKTEIEILQEQMAKMVSVTDPAFGAIGNGVADDTAAIQAAIDAVVATSTHTGGHLHFPAGTYLISSQLSIPRGVGWKITGDARGNTTIRQATANTPIFSISGAISWGWHVSDLNLDYSSAQPSTNTLAIGFYFDGATGQQVFSWSMQRVNFDKGYLFMASHASRSNAVWGFTMDMITVNSSTSGGAIRLVPSPSVGQPSIKIGTLYAVCTSMTLPLVNLNAANGFRIDQLEGNILTNISLLQLQGGCTGRVGTAKIELATYTTADTKAIEYSNSYFSIDDLILGKITVNVGIGNKWHALRQAGGTGGDVDIRMCSVDVVTLTSGNAYVVYSSSDANPVTIRGFLNFINVNLTDATSTAGADNLTIENWARQRVSTDNGDADKVLVMGDATIQRWSTTLTGNKTVTMPVRTGATGCNAFNGAWFRILRDAATPGAFTLTILNDSGSTLHTIASGTKQSVMLTWDRASGGVWRVMDVTTL